MAPALRPSPLRGVAWPGGVAARDTRVRSRSARSRGCPPRPSPSSSARAPRPGRRQTRTLGGPAAAAAAAARWRRRPAAPAAPPAAPAAPPVAAPSPAPAAGQPPGGARRCASRWRCSSTRPGPRRKVRPRFPFPFLSSFPPLLLFFLRWRWGRWRPRPAPAPRRRGGGAAGEEPGVAVPCPASRPLCCPAGSRIPPLPLPWLCGESRRCLPRPAAAAAGVRVCVCVPVCLCPCVADVSRGFLLPDSGGDRDGAGAVL